MKMRQGGEGKNPSNYEKAVVVQWSFLQPFCHSLSVITEKIEAPPPRSQSKGHDGLKFDPALVTGAGTNIRIHPYLDLCASLYIQGRA